MVDEGPRAFFVLAQGFHAPDVDAVIAPLMNCFEAAIGKRVTSLQDGRARHARAPGDVVELMRLSVLPALCETIREGLLLMGEDVHGEHAGLFDECPRGGGLIETHQRSGRIERPVVHFQYVFHARDELGAGLWRNAVVLVQVRLEDVF